jgi:ribose transport system substrate-binding protein
VQKTFNMGWISVEMLKNAMEGETIAEDYDTGVVIVSEDNVDSYMEDMKKELMSN